MSRVLQVSLLIALFVLALLAKSAGDILAAAVPDDAQVSVSAVFRGSVLPPTDASSILTVSGNALTGGQTLRAVLSFPFYRNGAGEVAADSQGTAVLRVQRLDGNRITMAASVSSVTFQIHAFSTGLEVVASGTWITTNINPTQPGIDLTDFDNTLVHGLETDVEGSLPWDPNQFQQTIDAMDTQHPRTSTPGGLTLQPPTVAPST